jgi:hypothetical protein
MYGGLSSCGMGLFKVLGGEDFRYLTFNGVRSALDIQ